MEKEAELRHKYDMMRIETRGTAEIERENWDIAKERIGVKATEERITKLEFITTFTTVIGLGMIIASAGGVAVGRSLYVKHNFGPVFRFLKGRLGKSSLVQETSRFTVSSAAKCPIKTIAQLIKRPDLMKGIILKMSRDQWECL